MRPATWRRRRNEDEPISGDAPDTQDAVDTQDPGDATDTEDATDNGDATTDELALPVVVPDEAEAPSLDRPPAPKRRPLYHRLLRLRHIAPTAWQRAAFADAPFALAVVLVLADVASAWTLLALPVAVAAVVKTHDLLAGALAGPALPPVQDGPQE